MKKNLMLAPAGLLTLVAVATACVKAGANEPVSGGTPSDASVALASNAPTKKVNAFYIGHSLMSDIPDMVGALAGDSFQFKEQFIPGAPLRWQWDEPTRNPQPGDQFRGVYDKMITAQTTHLVMIDIVPRGDEASLKESIDYAGRFLKFARSKNPQVAAYFYEPWHDITSGTPQRSPYDTASPTRELMWRPRIKADREKWDRVVADVNRANPGAVPMKLIPATTALGELSDAIDAGQIPGVRNIRELYDDTIHLTPLGKYFVAMVHYRALFGDLPATVPVQIRGRWGTPYWDTRDWAGKIWPAPKPETVAALRKVAMGVKMP